MRRLGALLPSPFDGDVEHVFPLELSGFAVDSHFGVTPGSLHRLHHLDGGQTHRFNTRTEIRIFREMRFQHVHIHDNILIYIYLYALTPVDAQVRQEAGCVVLH